MDLLENRFHINPTGDGGPVDHVQEIGEFLGDGRKLLVLECHLEFVKFFLDQTNPKGLGFLLGHYGTA